MPYIPELDRISLDIGSRNPANVGELNYKITKTCLDYISRPLIGLSYTSVNEVVGALECAKLELYRRLAAPYEDKKIALNGDVYPKT